MEKIERFREDYFWLSNMSLVKIVVCGKVYPSLENAFQACKTIDLSERIQFESCKPGKSKKLGRAVTLRPHWEHIKLEVMHDLIKQKFSKPNLKRMLLETGDRELIEGNYHNDKFWGYCLKTFQGENHLGKILMAIRDELREQQ